MFFKKLCVCSRSARNTLIFHKLSKAFSDSAVSEQQDSSDSSVVVVDKDANITLIGINRPKQRNAITAETAEKLSTAIIEFEADDSSPVAVLYGVGGTFSAGYDIKELELQGERGSLDFPFRHEGSIGPTRRHKKKPMVCGINGFCIASGLELALMCDLRVMEETAIMGFFNRQLGVPISDGGTVRLSSMVGYSTALDLILTGRRLTAKDALHMGLVNRVVATGTCLGQAVNLAFCIAKYPQASLVKDRNSLHTNCYENRGFRAAIQTEIMDASREILKELKEGIKLFKKPDSELLTVRGSAIPEWERKEIEIEEKRN